MKWKFDHIVRTILLAVLTGVSLGVEAQAPTPTDDGKKPKFGKGRSQIVDDSTKNVYGPKTTLWTTERSLFYNKKEYVPIDTAITNYHRWTYVQRFNNLYKDLGVMGTALSPIYPILSSTIGANSGFSVYEPYFQTEQPRYFDTKSPYTRIYVVWGGTGRATTRIEFSRNINPRWNFGFDYRPILCDKQIQYKKNDRQVQSQYYDFYTTYKSKKEDYFLLFDYRRIRHRVNENGGVTASPTDETKFFDKDAAVNLAHSTSEEKRSTLHLFQQYQLARPAQIYLTSDYSFQGNKFVSTTGPSATASTDPLSFFDYTRADSARTDDQLKLEVFQNEAGFKGRAGPLFYNFYAKNRAYSFRNYYHDGLVGEVLAYKKTGTERYLGGRVALTFDSLTEFAGSAEYLLDGNYKLEATWKSPWVDATGRSSLSKPGQMQQLYYGAHDIWSNNFSSVSALQMSGYLKGQFGRFFISPGASFTALSNYVFFREKVGTDSFQKVLPFQSSGAQTIFSPELRMTLRVLRNVYLRPQVIYTTFLKNDDDALHIPTTFVNMQFSYESSWFKKALQVQTGVDLHWKSDYNALAYDPVIQQYYVQDPKSANYFVSPAFILADVFFNAKIKRGKFFVKYHNVAQVVKGVGYIPTPGYQGQRSVIDFGFELLLFD